MELRQLTSFILRFPNNGIMVNLPVSSKGEALVVLLLALIGEHCKASAIKALLSVYNGNICRIESELLNLKEAKDFVDYVVDRKFEIIQLINVLTEK